MKTASTSIDQTFCNTQYPDFSWKYVKFSSSFRPLFRLTIQLPDIGYKYELQKKVMLLIKHMVFLFDSVIVV